MLSEEHVMPPLLTTKSEGSLNDKGDGETQYPAKSDILIHNDSNQEDDSVPHLDWKDTRNNVGREGHFNK
jgi:hypothetical protein